MNSRRRVLAKGESAGDEWITVAPAALHDTLTALLQQDPFVERFTRRPGGRRLSPSSRTPTPDSVETREIGDLAQPTRLATRDWFGW